MIQRGGGLGPPAAAPPPAPAGLSPAGAGARPSPPAPASTQEVYAVPEPAPPRGVGAWVLTLVRAPLLAKLVIADTIINVLSYLAMQNARQQYAQEIMVVALVVVLVLNAVLVYWALLPLKTLEAAAVRVSRGDLRARVRLPWLADRNIARIGNTLNALLDGVTADRARMRALASQVISAGDQERAHIARELHDSTAQSLSALDLLMTATLRDGCDAALTERLHVMQQIVGEALTEVRLLSHAVHPRVLDDLGLVPALEGLARQTRETTGLEARVTSDVRTTLRPDVASALYRVAQEAVRNAVRHAGARTIRLAVTGDASAATLTIVDDGAGFDVGAAEARRTGMGLFTMRERVGLVEGTLEITSEPDGGGTRLHAWVPLPPAEERGGERRLGERAP
jgi:signal transduction histidine kinase